MSNLTGQETRGAVSSEEKPKPTSLRECRTFGDLMALREARPIGGVCKRCGQWNVDGWHYSVRASICESCAEKAKDEVLPGVVASERKARRWVNAPDRNYGEKDVAFLASVSGASQAYVRKLISERESVKRADILNRGRLALRKAGEE